jgi:hypothetical protein
MRYWSTLTLSVASVLAIMGCHSSQPETAIAPEDLMGTYRFERAGTNLGRSWSVRSVLTLEDAGHYVIDNTIRTSDETNDETETGTYRIDRSKVVLRSEKNESQELIIKGDSLVARLDWPGRWFVRWAGGAPVYVKQRTR